LAVALTFVAADLTAWTLFFYNRSQGRKYERRFEKYANSHWNPDDYVSFLEQSTGLSTGYLGRGSDIDRQRLDEAENEWGTLSGASVHHLYETGRQQYYEMIYKYPEQFALGWDDAVSNSQYFPQTGFTRFNATDNMLYYRGLRNKSNQHFGASRGMVGALLINRLLSVMDAVIFVGRSNHQIHAQMRITSQYNVAGRFTAAPTLRIEF
ncbi:MAG: hypothetical protein KDC45_00155, partial [Bacteroidetes bacterium]|nr:hypothetical protein [Bacteroidota bacterium]